ncbi:hypothetical protein E2F47_02020 [Mycobacterium eburneum]|nr:hypothetical protein E2F47_02020 [Mycobacterium eburneum]
MFLAVATIGIPLVSTACIGPGWTDHDDDIVSELKIEIPKSATNIVGHAGKGIDFLIPNTEWRAYVAKYYPGKTLSQRPSKEIDGSVPAECIPAFRSGTELSHWITGEDIQYRNTNNHVYRFVRVTPDCEPGKAFVQWRLGEPE